MDVSIIVVNWNTKEVTKNCLNSIYDSIDNLNFEVILIDNGSTDGSQEMVKNTFPQVTLLRNDSNRGFAAANNQGFAIAEGRYLLLLNSDTLISKGAIEKTIQFGEQYSEAGVIGCRIINPDNSLQPSCFMFPSVTNLFLSASYLYKIFPRNRFFGRELMTWWLHDSIKEVEAIRGCFMLVKRAAFKEVGKLDESFFMYGEETDWCLRFRKKGWKVIFTPKAEIVHLGKESSKNNPAILLQVRSGILQFIDKHRPKWVYFLSCIMMSCWFGIRIFPWLVKSIINFRNNGPILGIYLKGAFLSLGGWKNLSTIDSLRKST